MFASGRDIDVKANDGVAITTEATIAVKSQLYKGRFIAVDGASGLDGAVMTLFLEQ